MRELREYEEVLDDLREYISNQNKSLGKDWAIEDIEIIKELIELKRPKELIELDNCKACPTCLEKDIYDEEYDTHDERAHYYVKKYCGTCGQLLVQKEEDCW